MQKKDFSVELVPLYDQRIFDPSVVGLHLLWAQVELFNPSITS